MPFIMPPAMLDKLIPLARKRKMPLSALINEIMNQGLALVEADTTPPSRAIS